MAALAVASCDNAYPEVVVVNDTGERLLLREVSFNGCLWPDVIAYGEATSPQRCLPGSDRVHFKKLDAGKYCEQQARTLDGVCGCDGGVGIPAAPSDPGLIGAVPLWFSYQTLSEHSVGYGDFQRIEITLADMEQDFSIPGPYGH